MDEASQGFMKHNGGLSFKKIDETNYEFEVGVKDIHLNSGKIAHGGFLSTIADSGMGTAAHQAAESKRSKSETAAISIEKFAGQFVAHWAQRLRQVSRIDTNPH